MNWEWTSGAPGCLSGYEDLFRYSDSLWRTGRLWSKHAHTSTERLLSDSKADGMIESKGGGEMDNAKIGKLIYKLRKESQMTQLQLAEWLNVSDKAVSKWERGDSHS